MKRTPYPLILTGLMLIGILAACNMPSNPFLQTGTATPEPATIPTGTATSTLLPTATAPTTTSTPELAPLCDPNAAVIPTPASCQLPIAEEGSAFCSKKVPYNLILINSGATYEVLNEGFHCSDAGTKDGKQLVTCTGPMASQFRVKVCDPACAIPTVQAKITQCPEGFNYNAIQGCCTQEPNLIDRECGLLLLDTISCKVDCSEFTKKADCYKNSNSCWWNDKDNVCRLRE